jgi:hypothetical protein
VIADSPIVVENGMLSCPTCVTKVPPYLERAHLSYIQVPTLRYEVSELQNASEDDSIGVAGFIITFIFFIGIFYILWELAKYGNSARER